MSATQLELNYNLIAELDTSDSPHTSPVWSDMGVMFKKMCIRDRLHYCFCREVQQYILSVWRQRRRQRCADPGPDAGRGAF